MNEEIICDACRNPIDRAIYQVEDLAKRGYDHILCDNCINFAKSNMRLVNFILALHARNTLF